MQVEMRLLGIMTAEDGEDLPGHKHIREITIDMGALFEVTINDETMGHRIEVPITKKVLTKKFMEATSTLINSAAGIQIGEVTLNSFTALLKRTGNYGGLLISEDAPPEVLATLREAGVNTSVPAMPAGSTH